MKWTSETRRIDELKNVLLKISIFFVLSIVALMGSIYGACVSLWNFLEELVDIK